MTFPLIIANGGSQVCPSGYALRLDLPIDEVKLFPEVVAENLGGHCINVAVAGSCNDRIIRRMIVECLNQRALNPTQPIIALIEITFLLRKEIWREDYPTSDPSESNFHSVQLARLENWWELSRGKNTINGGDIIFLGNLNSAEQKYLKLWQQGEMFFYSPYAENIRLLSSLVALTGLFKHNNIDYLIFRGNPVEKFEPEYVMDFLQKQLEQDPGILDLTNFSFTQWTLDRDFVPLDSLDLPTCGHPSLDAHRAFGNYLSTLLKKQ